MTSVWLCEIHSKDVGISRDSAERPVLERTFDIGVKIDQNRQSTRGARQPSIGCTVSRLARLGAKSFGTFRVRLAEGHGKIPKVCLPCIGDGSANSITRYLPP